MATDKIELVRGFIALKDMLRDGRITQQTCDDAVANWAKGVRRKLGDVEGAAFIRECIKAHG